MAGAAGPVFSMLGLMGGIVATRLCPAGDIGYPEAALMDESLSGAQRHGVESPRSGSMSEDIAEKSLVEEIVADMFVNLEELEEFDADVLQRLKQLAASGNLRKAREVIRAIEEASGGIE